MMINRAMSAPPLLAAILCALLRRSLMHLRLSIGEAPTPLRIPHASALRHDATVVAPPFAQR